MTSKWVLGVVYFDQHVGATPKTGYTCFIHFYTFFTASIHLYDGGDGGIGGHGTGRGSGRPGARGGRRVGPVQLGEKDFQLPQAKIGRPRQLPGLCEELWGPGVSAG